MSVDDILKKAAAKTNGKKSKSKVPGIDVSSDPTLVEAVSDWLKAKQKETQAESDRKMAEGILLPACMERRQKLIQETKEHVSSVKVSAGDKSLTMKTSKQYTAIPIEREPVIQEIFGEEGFKKYFDVFTEIKLKDGVAKDRKVLEKLIKAVGEDKFVEMFDVVQTIKPTDALITDRDMDVSVAAQHEKAVVDGLVHPYKPSFVS